MYNIWGTEIINIVEVSINPKLFPYFSGKREGAFLVIIHSVENRST